MINFGVLRLRKLSQKSLKYSTELSGEKTHVSEVKWRLYVPSFIFSQSPIVYVNMRSIDW